MKKRIIACLLAGLMSVSSLSVISPSVSAAGLGYWPEPLPMGNQWYYQNESLQPYGSCFQIDELKKWSPDNDPDARYNRGLNESFVTGKVSTFSLSVGWLFSLKK